MLERVNVRYGFGNGIISYVLGAFSETLLIRNNGEVPPAVVRGGVVILCFVLRREIRLIFEIR